MFPLALLLRLCLSACSSCVSIDPRCVESGDGAVTGGHASCWSSVSVLSQEASKSRF